MAACCGAPRCSCRVVAGPGVTVAGNGSPAAPYIVSADGGAAAPTPVTAGDTSTVDTSVTGTGTAGDPWVVSADVILDPAPPAGGTNLLQAGPSGLSVECAGVRGCFGADGPATYDPATGTFGVDVSADPGNQLVPGSDGGLFVGAAPPAALAVEDGPGVDLTLSGTGAGGDPYTVTGAVVLDPAPPGGGAQLLQLGPGGLSLECGDVRGCFSGGDGIAYDSVSGQFSARLSGDPGNAVVIGGDGGLYAPPGGGDPTALAVADSATVDLGLTGTGAAGDPYTVTADVVLDPAPPGGGANLLQQGTDGLYLECGNVRGCISAGDGAAYDPATGVVSSRLSADAGNQAGFGGDGGLYVPVPAPPEVGCGLAGDGSAGSPLTVVPVAGDAAWSAVWDCDAAANSTLHCDPGTGALWTPPEHTSAAATVQQQHWVAGTSTIPVTGWIIIDPNAWSQGQYTADSLSPCRAMSFEVTFAGHAELTWPENATFEVGYAAAVDGGTPEVRRMFSRLAAGPAGHDLVSFTTHHSFSLPPHTGADIRVYPAIRVITGSVTINGWLTETQLFASTR